MTSRRRLFIMLALILSFAVPPSLVRAQDDTAGEAPKPKKKKKKAPSKAEYYEKSKYKSYEAPATSAYKFNEKAEPIVAGAKKPVSKKKKRSEPPEIGDSCGSEQSCADKKSEADAL